MDGTTLDEYVKILRACVSANLDVQKQMLLFPEEDREEIWKEFVERTKEITKVPATVLHQKGRKPWDFKSNDGITWRKLKQYLLEHVGRSEDELDTLDSSTDRILSCLADPNEEGDGLEPVKGLVIGYVQSGKTANYTALTAKAFDAGYQVVIVLSGIHRSLRRQTQIRMDDELGIPGVGKERITAKYFGPKAQEKIIPMTSEDLEIGDSSYSGVHRNIMAQGKLLFVVKKNTSVLERLIFWFGEDEKVTVPALIIDDEADQASINTGGNRSEVNQDPDLSNPDEPEESPAVINSKIRRLVKIFNNVSYVGYTATPYANVFIDHEAVDIAAGDDLYPKDFIVSLAKPAGYFGPEELFDNSQPDEETFGKNGYESKVIEIVPTSDVNLLTELLAEPGLEESRYSELPESLKRAVRTFILATAALCQVNGEKIPTAMLIHTTPSKIAQNSLSKLISKYVDVLRRKWRYEQQEGVVEEWQKEWEEFSSSFKETKYLTDFENIRSQLERLLSYLGNLSVLTLNSDSSDELDYQYYPYGANIVIGGNKLSRGLTIEGLLVSYFTRKASDPKADTLTQMGRFFGHRKATVDISKIFTTYDLKIAFKEVALVESALRDDIKRYEKLGLKPIDFGPRVLKREFLMPTARNKMGVAAQYGNTYEGELIQTTSFPNDLKKIVGPDGKLLNLLESNLLATKRLVGKLGGPDVEPESEVSSRLRWSNVNVSLVLEYLESYSGVEDATRFVPSKIATYIRDLSSDQKSLELTNWTISIIGRQLDVNLGKEDFGTKYSVGRVRRALDSGSVTSSIGTLVAPLALLDSANGPKFRGDELEDLNLEDVNACYKSGLKLDEARRLVRQLRPKERGLLLIYPISPESIGSAGNKAKQTDKTLGQALFQESPQLTIVGLALVFPDSEIEIAPYWQGKAGNQDV